MKNSSFVLGCFRAVSLFNTLTVNAQTNDFAGSAVDIHYDSTFVQPLYDGLYNENGYALPNLLPLDFNYFTLFPEASGQIILGLLGMLILGGLIQVLGSNSNNIQP